LLHAALTVALLLIALAPAAAQYPAPEEGDWIARDFQFHTGEVIPELRVHYTTIGAPTGEPVLILHGTTQSGAAMLSPAFAGELFGPGQPLDASKHYIILPDGIGHGKTSKPSDGMRAKFPRYNYDDMVAAQYKLVTEGLGLRRLRLVLGNSMGGMHTWIWGVSYPDFMDALVPMASQPTALASRSWMLQRMMLEVVRNDPDYNNGNYVTQPRLTKIASIFFGIATAGGTLNYQSLAPTREKADEFIDMRLASTSATDANDFLWQWSSAADYDASGDLEKIQATVLAINSIDDEVNPPETGLMTRAMKRLKNGRLFLILTSDETSGHLTTGQAKFYKQVLQRLLDAVPRKAL
jgi:homoserine O-acetyltransferase